MKVEVVKRADGYYVAYNYGAMRNLRFGPYRTKEEAKKKAKEKK